MRVFFVSGSGSQTVSYQPAWLAIALPCKATWGNIRSTTREEACEGHLSLEFTQLASRTAGSIGAAGSGRKLLLESLKLASQTLEAILHMQHAEYRCYRVAGLF